MRHIRKYITGSLALPLLLFSCTDNGLSVVSPKGSANGGMVRTELSISTPAALNASLTRAVSVANESTLNGNFAVFGFDSSADTLMFVLKTDSLAASSTTYGTGDTNTESNLNGKNDYASAYGDYTESPSIAWHPADQTNSSGRLYIEYWETPDPVHLLVLSNVDSTAIAALLTATTDETDPTQTIDPAIKAGMSFAEVTAALAPALDYAVKDANASYMIHVIAKAEGDPDPDTANPGPEYIPMTGEYTLEDGITLGSKGEISLRRSVAKMSFSFEWTTDYYETDEQGHVNLSDTVTVDRDYDKNPRKFKIFIPDSIVIENIYRYATVYAGPSTELEPDTTNTEANISTLNLDEQGDTTKYDATIPITADDFYYDTAGNLHLSVDFFLAETLNSRMDAYTQQGSGGSDFSPNDYPRVSVMIAGHYYDTDNTDAEDRWYRLDLIPDHGGDVGGNYEELSAILRNHHYAFTISNPTKRPSSNIQEANELSVPDNYHSTDSIFSLVVIENEDYVSITADAYAADTSGVPYYIAVSSTSVNLARSENACALVKMETNYPNWSLDENELPWVRTTDEGQRVYAMDIVYDDSSNTIYVWLDEPGYVRVGETYAYFIVAGNIRKKMRITIGEGTYDGEDYDPLTDGDGTSGDTP